MPASKRSRADDGERSPRDDNDDTEKKRQRSGDTTDDSRQNPQQLTSVAKQETPNINPARVNMPDRDPLTWTWITNKVPYVPVFESYLYDCPFERKRRLGRSRSAEPLTASDRFRAETWPGLRSLRQDRLWNVRFTHIYSITSRACVNLARHEWEQKNTKEMIKYLDRALKHMPGSNHATYR
uniref:DUF5664 domain-containing protein n=1 Tax=Panagrellus redivivus TaxID=6233 RepID=A0A7E4UPB7_PANRE